MVEAAVVLEEEGSTVVVPAVDSVSVAAELDSGSGDASVGATVVSCGGCSSGTVGFDVSGFEPAEGVVSWLEASSVVSGTGVDDSAGPSVTSGSAVVASEGELVD